MGISELELTDYFERLLARVPDNIADFKYPVVRELDCQNAFPDILATRTEPQRFSTVLDPCMAHLISILNSTTEVSFEHLFEQSGRSKSSVLKAIYSLEAECWVDITPARAVILRRQQLVFSTELWSFELKLHNWKRALYQATRNQNFADYSCVVLPSATGSAAIAAKCLFHRLGVGLLTCDFEKGSLNWVVEPQKVSEFDLGHKLLVYSRFFQAYEKLQNTSYTSLACH